MAAEAITPPPSPPSACEKTQARIAVLLMLGAAAAELWAAFRKDGHMPMSNFAMLSSGGFVQAVSRPSAWTLTRPWAKSAASFFAVILVLISLVAFILMIGDFAQAARNSFDSIRREVFLFLPAGMTGLILVMTLLVRSASRAAFLPVATLFGAWILLPYLFPLSLPVIIWIVLRKQELFPELPVQPQRSSQWE